MRKSRYFYLVLLRKTRLLTTPNNLENISLILAMALVLCVFAPYGTTPKDQRIIIASPFTLPCLILYFYSQKKRRYKLIE